MMNRPQSAIIIIPPFAAIDRPSLGAHILQAVAAERGAEVSVFYANMLFASLIGEEAYQAIVGAPPLDLAGERCLAPLAYPFKFADRSTQQAKVTESLRKLNAEQVSLEVLTNAFDVIHQALKNLLSDYTGIIGFSSTFEQINATIILSGIIHNISPSLTQIVGGANCEGEMALGQAALLPHVSHVFSGESEQTFVDFLMDTPKFRDTRIIRGKPTSDLDSLPCPVFSEYLSQFSATIGHSLCIRKEDIRFPYESSRGCWWGAKHHCTFCGLNGEGMSFRAKKAEKVLHDLQHIGNMYEAKNVFMTDNIMPHQYFRTLVPLLSATGNKIDIFYEQKANIDLKKAMALAAAGIRTIQPGIESLHSGPLHLMRKGIKAHQNIQLLRYCRSVGIDVAWNIIYGFPGELLTWYEEIDSILPLLSHLYPPNGICDLSIDRFSPYFDESDSFGITDIRPHQSYHAAILAEVDLVTVAYHFEGNVTGGLQKSSPLYVSLRTKVEAWRNSWSVGDRSPMLHIVVASEGFLLLDTRSAGGLVMQQITEQQAMACLTIRPKNQEETSWALDNGYSILMDGLCVPLVTAEPDVLLAAESGQLIGSHNS